MSIEEILEAMDIELDKSKNVPLTRGKSLIDVEQFRDLIGQVRLNLPGEIKQAQALVNDRRVIINDAKAEAESIIRKAEEKSESYGIRGSYHKAGAEQGSRDTHLGADKVQRD